MKTDMHWMKTAWSIEKSLWTRISTICTSIIYCQNLFVYKFIFFGIFPICENFSEEGTIEENLLESREPTLKSSVLWEILIFSLFFFISLKNLIFQQNPHFRSFSRKFRKNTVESWKNHKLIEKGKFLKKCSFFKILQNS